MDIIKQPSEVDSYKEYIQSSMNNYITPCIKCSNKASCPCFTMEYNEALLYYENKLQTEKDKASSNNENSSMNGMYMQQEHQYEIIKRNKEQIITKYLQTHYSNKTCKYERDIITNTFNMLQQIYISPLLEIDNTPSNNDMNNKFSQKKENLFTILSIFEQIIKLKLQDYRLMLLQKEYGVAQNISQDKAYNKIKLTPGMHYSLEISNQIGSLYEKLDKILYKVREETTNNTVKIINFNDIFPNHIDTIEENNKYKKIKEI